MLGFPREAFPMRWGDRYPPYKGDRKERNMLQRHLRAPPVLCCLLTTFAARAQSVWYVEDHAALGGDGTSWSAAYGYLQDAQAVATAGDEIRVAGGTYKPDQDEGGNVTPGDRGATFQLINGVSLYGGYRGCPGGDCTSGDSNQRDIETYETTLSGDLNGDDGPAHIENFAACYTGTQSTPASGCEGFNYDNDGDVDEDDLAAFLNANNYTENSYHIVTGNGTDAAVSESWAAMLQAAVDRKNAGEPPDPETMKRLPPVARIVRAHFAGR